METKSYKKPYNSLISALEFKFHLLSQHLQKCLTEFLFAAQAVLHFTLHCVV